jgi:ketosteroid isomerase-like protein
MSEEDDDVSALRCWFDRWGSLVAAVDFKTARALFRDDVVGFGTHMDLVADMDALEAQQWRRVWPTIKDFRFHSELMEARVSPDGLMAVGLCVWSSTGFHEDGTPFPRPGRASVVFRRDDINSPWLANHTHISLNPGTPQKSFGVAAVRLTESGKAARDH